MADAQASKKSVIRRRFPWGWMVLALISVLAVGGFLAQQNAPVPVGTVPPTVFKAGERNPLVTASGYIVARTRATLSSKVLGRISWLGVQEGSRVQQGQVIAKLEAPDLMASRNAVASQLAQTELDLARSQKLVKDGILDQASLDRLVNLAKQQAEQLKYQDALLESMVLRAPFTGVVTQKLSEVGETVAPGSAGGANAINAIAVLVDFNSLEVEVEVNEGSIAKLKKGMPAEIRVDALEGRTEGAKVLKGQLREIYPSSNRQKAVIIVRVAFVEKDPLLVPDMGAKVTFLGDTYKQDVVVLGREQVVKRNGQSFAWAVENGAATLKPIAVLAENPIGLEVSGIKADTQLIVAPPENLKAGAKVSVKAK
ncbi:MAG: efflux RND transporter periplasmic adaptor subunit [Acidobacteriota bacterium]|nr:efflux RND transporter periplasmic adaptor subunit [Acidobacteriota bacterium]